MGPAAPIGVRLRVRLGCCFLPPLPPVWHRGFLREPHPEPKPQGPAFSCCTDKKKTLLQHLPCPPLHPRRQQNQDRTSPCREHCPHPKLRASPPPTAPSSPEEGISEQQTTRQLPATHPVHVGALQQP